MRATPPYTDTAASLGGLPTSLGSGSQQRCAAPAEGSALVVTGRTTLHAELGAWVFDGTQYEGGSFELEGGDGAMDGAYAKSGGLEQLRGSFTVGGAAGDMCEPHWQFTATRR